MFKIQNVPEQMEFGLDIIDPFEEGKIPPVGPFNAVQNGKGRLMCHQDIHTAGDVRFRMAER